MDISNKQIYDLTFKHFSNIDFTKTDIDTVSESNSDINSNSSDESNNSSDESDNSSDESNNSDKSNNSSDKSNNLSDKSNNSSSNTKISNNESESDSDSEDLKVDSNDLFNTKTNGNEFFSEVLNNRYLILKKLGYGSFSSVWMSFDVNENILVAVKIINPEDYREGILELQTYLRLKKLDCTYLLTIIDYFQVAPIHYKYFEESYKKQNKERNHIVMILPLMACSTYDLLKCNEYENGLPLDVCVKIIHQTILGINELEQNNLMHTDLKPENILVCGLNREAEVLLKIINDIDIKQMHKNQLSQKKNVSDIWIESYKLYKDITKTIILFMNKEMKEIKEQMKICKVSSKYINDIKIKICDFNLVINTDEKLGNQQIQIQTRYYRAPEIILGCGLHSKTDYWSIACVLFELLTGNILFDPGKDKLKSRDVHHMYLIEELMGSVPKNMLSNGIRTEKIYNDNGYLININKKIKISQLKYVFKESHDNLGLSDDILSRIINYLESLLQINPDLRPNMKTLIDNTSKLN
jgi:serine/threonine-protein kinase SRPK3